MERIFAIFRLGVRYLYRYRRRYSFLFAAMIFGFAIVTFITSAKDGMYDNVYYSVQSHYAGDIVAAAFDTDTTWTYCRRMGQDETAVILNAADVLGIKAQHAVLRTLYTSSAVAHYNGIAIRFANLVGCDWEGESHLFDKMVFEESSEFPYDDDGIVLSVPIAQQLGARIGDRVIIELETRFGQKNTGLYIVRGIVQDTSVLGYYKAYISRVALNRLIVYDDDDCSIIGFFLDNPAAAEQDRIRLQEFLSERMHIGPLVYDRDGLSRERNRSVEERKGVRVFLYTMPVYLSEVSYLLDAMSIITYFLYGMMLLTILVSSTVTYRLILHERSREIGIMRVIGFYGGDLRLVLWTEIIILGLISMVSGFILARLLSWAVSFLSFSWFPGFEIFLNNGRLTAMYQPETILINVILLLFILFALVFIPTFRVSRKNLPELLSGESL